MDPKLQEQIDELSIKVEAIYKSVEKTRRYIQWTVWITIALVVLPAVLLAFAIPAMIDSLSGFSSLTL